MNIAHPFSPGFLVTLCTSVLVSGCFMNPEDLTLPVYKTDQTDSTHEGYRHTTLTSGSLVYVNDFEECSLQLMNPVPTQVIGREEFGDGKVCAIEGQKITAYIAADVGSEMPAYAVFRALHQPPYDWRKTTFQKMRFAIPTGPAANKETTDSLLIQDVLKTLRDGTPTISASLIPTNQTNWKRFSALLLSSDDLPGIEFAVGVYMDNDGGFYLAENQYAKHWIKANDVMNQWMQTK